MADRNTPMTKEGMENTKKGPRCERIARQGFVWLDAHQAHLGDKQDRDKQRAERLERWNLANVLAEERKR